MKKFKNHTLKEYLDVLSARKAVPGGGSVSALTGSLATGLLAMVAEYSCGKGQSKAVEGKLVRILKELIHLRNEFLTLVDADAEAYLNVRATKQKSFNERRKAQRAAIAVQKKVIRLSYKAIKLTPYLVEKGSKYLLSDIEVAMDLLLATFNAAQRLCKP